MVFIASEKSARRGSMGVCVCTATLLGVIVFLLENVGFIYIYIYTYI